MLRFMYEKDYEVPADSPQPPLSTLGIVIDWRFPLLNPGDEPPPRSMRGKLQDGLRSTNFAAMDRAVTKMRQDFNATGFAVVRTLMTPV
jgi:hypothetical protein